MYHVREDAFSTSTQDQIILRLLVGVQRGAEMPLVPAAYVIGKGEDSDIVLADESVQNSHALLTVLEDSVTIEARDGQVLFNDRVLEPGEQAELDLPVALSMGLVAIGIGAQTTDWTALPIMEPQPKALASEADGPAQDGNSQTEGMADDGLSGTEEGSQEAAGEDATDQSQPDSDNDEDLPENETKGDDTPGTEDPDEAAGKAGAQFFGMDPQRARLVAAGSIGVLVAAVVVIVGLNALSDRGTGDDQDTPTAAATPEETKTAAMDIVGTLGLDEVIVATDAAGSLVATGFVPTAEDRNELQSALSEAGLAVSNKTRSVEQTLESVRVTLSALSWPEPNYETHLVTTYNGNGEFDIDGFLGPEVDVGDLRRRVQSDVPGIGELRFTRSEVSAWKEILDRSIDDVGLSLWLKTTEDGAKIRVTGQLTAAQAETWRTVGEAFVKESRGWPKLSIGVTAGRQLPPVVQPDPETTFQAPTGTEDRPGLTVIGVVVSDGKPSHVLLSTGETLAEGGVLDSGGVVTSIEMDSVTITKDEQNFIYRVKGGK